MKINKPICIIFIFLITLVLIFLFLIPKYEKLNESKTEVALKTIEYDGKSVYYATIAKLGEGINERRAALEKIDSALPSDFRISSIVYFFQEKGEETGVFVKSMALSQDSDLVEGETIKDITFSLHVAATYDNFKKFISSLDKSARLFEINSISFNTGAAGKQAASQQLYEFNIEVVVHTY